MRHTLTLVPMDTPAYRQHLADLEEYGKLSKKRERAALDVRYASENTWELKCRKLELLDDELAALGRKINGYTAY